MFLKSCHYKAAAAGLAMYCFITRRGVLGTRMKTEIVAASDKKEFLTLFEKKCHAAAAQITMVQS